MRGIVGYIRNLADGGGPPVGTVDVSAIPTAKPPDTEVGEIGEVKHRLGRLLVLHQPGSQSATKANEAGKFGWQMELSPGPIDIRVTPHDPQTEYRRRFPDESAQIGKGFLTDIERLGWAGGKDGLIWDGVYGGHQPTAAQWTNDPVLSANFGNWRVAGTGSGPTAGRVAVGQGIAMLGGVVFSVEMGDLLLPVEGDPPMPPNTSANDRWDVFCLRLDWNPSSPEYGKQSFEVIRGQEMANAVPPPFPGNTGNYRRLPLWAVKMKANTNFYEGAYDLRKWANLPSGLAGTTSINRMYQTLATQTTHATNVFNSDLNLIMSQQEIILPTGFAWDGYVVWSGLIRGGFPLDNGRVSMRVLTEGRATPSGPIVGANAVAGPPQAWNGIWRTRQAGGEQNPFSVQYALNRIPAYHTDSATGPSRSWSRLRIVASIVTDGSIGDYNFEEQQILVHLWPVM